MSGLSKFWVTVIVTVGVTVLNAVNVVAEPASGKTVITSDSLLFDYQRSICIFEGNVVAKEPRVTLTCEKLYVYFDENNQVDSIVAKERVVVRQDNRTGTCEKAVYTAADGAIVMTGNPVLRRGQDELAGEEIKIFVHSQKVISTPGRLVVFPGGENPFE